jgi:hypothetical protein
VVCLLIISMHLKPKNYAMFTVIFQYIFWASFIDVILSKQNPLHIMKKVHCDDRVIVKCDIETSTIEVPLDIQIFNNSLNLEVVIDQLYFQHQLEKIDISGSWRYLRIGAIKASLDVFQNLHKMGIRVNFMSLRDNPKLCCQ